MALRIVHSKLKGSLRPSAFVSPGLAHSNARGQQHRALHIKVTAAAEVDIPEPREPGPEDCCQSEPDNCAKRSSSRPNAECPAIRPQAAAWSVSGSNIAASCSSTRLRKPGSVGRLSCL